MKNEKIKEITSSDRGESIDARKPGTRSRFQCAAGFTCRDGRIRPLYFTATNFLATIACASFVSMKSKNARTSPEGTSFVTKIRGRLSG